MISSQRVLRWSFLWLLLWLTKSQDDSNSPHPSRATEETCQVQPDGTCLSQNEEDTSYLDIILPPVDYSDMMNVGYGEPQLVTGAHVEETRRALQRMVHYFETEVNNRPEKYNDEVREECQNRNSNCGFWAAIGECEVNPAYSKSWLSLVVVVVGFASRCLTHLYRPLCIVLMVLVLLQCAAVCRTCEQLDFNHRCPMPENVDELNALKPGDLEDLFARIVNDYKDTATILTRPGTPHDVVGEAAWVVQLDDFLSEEECDRLVELGAQQGYEQSKDVGEKKFDGTYDSKEDKGRTSKNTWCLEECFEDPMTKSVLKKIEDLTGISDRNSEYLQLLQYQEGQFYNEHHDYIPHHINRPSGPRILTVFLYLNNVEAGGGTHFNNLEVTCQPKKGRAVIWPSVKNEDPSQKDFRTHHEALPVEKGIKYGANAWIHLRDFKTPYHKSCI